MNLSQAFTQIGQWFAALAQQVLPAGGTAGQVLTKVDGTDWNVEWGTPTGGTLSIAGANADGGVTYENDSSLTVSWMADSSLAFRRTGPGVYGLTRPSELILASGGSYGIPMFSDTAVILYDSPDSTLFDATNGFAQNKPLRIVQLGAGQVKLDGFAIKCVGLPITNTTNSVIDVIPSALGATVVSGDLAAADTASYYTGLDESTTGFLTNYGCTVDSGGIFNQGTDIQSSRTRDQVPTARAYAEFSVLINGGGTFGFAKSGWLGGELGLNADSMALRVSGDLADLEVWHNGAAVATIAGAGSLGTGVNRFGVLVDRATAEFWIISTGGVWVGPDPATDPGLPFFPGGIGGSDAWLALEARPSGGEQRLFYLPSSLTWATEATAAGAVQIGWLHP